MRTRVRGSAMHLRLAMTALASETVMIFPVVTAARRSSGIETQRCSPGAPSTKLHAWAVKTTGVEVSHAAKRASSPAFDVCACTTVGVSRRIKRAMATRARQSFSGWMGRVSPGTNRTGTPSLDISSHKNPFSPVATTALKPGGRFAIRFEHVHLRAAALRSGDDIEDFHARTREGETRFRSQCDGEGRRCK